MRHLLAIVAVALLLSATACESPSGSSGGGEFVGSDAYVGADTNEPPADAGGSNDVRACPKADDPRCAPPADSTSAGEISAFVLTDDGECPSAGCQLQQEADGWLCYGYNDGLEYFGAPADDQTAREYCDGTWAKRHQPQG